MSYIFFSVKGLYSFIFILEYILCSLPFEISCKNVLIFCDCARSIYPSRYYGFIGLNQSEFFLYFYFTRYLLHFHSFAFFLFFHILCTQQYKKQNQTKQNIKTSQTKPNQKWYLHIYLYMATPIHTCINKHVWKCIRCFHSCLCTVKLTGQIYENFFLMNRWKWKMLGC